MTGLACLFGLITGIAYLLLKLGGVYYFREPFHAFLTQFYDSDSDRSVKPYQLRRLFRMGSRLLMAYSSRMRRDPVYLDALNSLPSPHLKLLRYLNGLLFLTVCFFLFALVCFMATSHYG